MKRPAAYLWAAPVSVAAPPARGARSGHPRSGTPPRRHSRSIRRRAPRTADARRPGLPDRGDHAGACRAGRERGRSRREPRPRARARPAVRDLGPALSASLSRVERRGARPGPRRLLRERLRDRGGAQSRPRHEPAGRVRGGGGRTPAGRRHLRRGHPVGRGRRLGAGAGGEEVDARADRGAPGGRLRPGAVGDRRHGRLPDARSLVDAARSCGGSSSHRSSPAPSRRAFGRPGRSGRPPRPGHPRPERSGSPNAPRFSSTGSRWLTGRAARASRIHTWAGSTAPWPCGS